MYYPIIQKGKKTMSKNTLFFSHSSKDKEMILCIKNKIEKATGKVLDIFMSSDGQSIPFGTNWIHKIEEGLEQAKLMFVFVTDNSINSGWIYFEAGFAYSKGIQVIPVGIGIDIGLLKAPLNLLQGFNINAPDSLNNFISIINKTFNYDFDEIFSQNDYLDILNKQTNKLNTYNLSIEDLFYCEEYILYSEYPRSEGSKLTYDINDYINKIIKHLDQNNIHYTKLDINSTAITTRFLFKGIQLDYFKGRDKRVDSMVDTGEAAKVSFRISPYNFEHSFSVLLDLMQLRSGDSNRYLNFYFRHNIVCITANEDLSSILSEYPDEFTYDEILGVYKSIKCNLSFTISNKTNSNNNSVFTLNLRFDCTKIKATDIIAFINRMDEIKILKRIPENTN